MNNKYLFIFVLKKINYIFLMEKNKEMIICNTDKNIFRHKRNKKSKKSKKNKCHSNKNANLVRNHKFYEFENLSPEKPTSMNNIYSINQDYKKDLFDKYSEFLGMKKFKISNNFDAKNSKKFLEKKNKCLEKIILSDKIENEKSNDKDLSIDSNYKKKKFRTQKSINKYFIVISNYDEEKSRNSEMIDNDINN